MAEIRASTGHIDAPEGRFDEADGMRTASLAKAQEEKAHGLLRYYKGYLPRDDDDLLASAELDALMNQPDPWEVDAAGDGGSQVGQAEPQEHEEQDQREDARNQELEDELAAIFGL